MISGDTILSENLMEKAEGADLIIHEVVAVAANQLEIPFVKGILEIHTTPEQAGLLFAHAKPKMAVFTHILLSGVTEEELVEETRKTYSGPLMVGQDLMTFVVGDDVTVVNQ